MEKSVQIPEFIHFIVVCMLKLILDIHEQSSKHRFVGLYRGLYYPVV